MTIADMRFENYSGKHAIEIDTPGTYTFDNVFFDQSGTADVENTSGGAVTINVINGGTEPTVTNTGGGSTTSVVNNKTFKFTVNPSVTGYEWRIYEVTAVGSLAGVNEVDGEESATADNQTYTYPSVASQAIAVQIIYNGGDYEEAIEYYTLTPTSQEVIINLERDNNN